MESAFVFLLVMCLVMLVGSYAAGVLPLSVRLSERGVAMLSTFGGGLLIGTALQVILPEGVQSLYTVQHQQHHPDTNSTHILHDEMHGEMDASFHARQWIGPTLALGFLFMFLVDQIGADFHGHTHQPVNVNSPPSSTPISVDSSYAHIEDATVCPDTPRPSSANLTLGLLIHCAADGVAMGAASASGQKALEMIVYLAVLLHKAPAAFGLSSFLLKSGLSLKDIRKHILVFSLSSPVAAILTFLAIQLAHVVQNPTETSNASPWMGVLLLFSAGTFLYVATIHVLPEVYHHIQVLKSEQVGSMGPCKGLFNRHVLFHLCLFVASVLLPGFLVTEHAH